MEDRNYFSDHRVRAGERSQSSPIKQVNESKKTAVFEINSDDETTEMELPIVFEICPTCEGSGKHVNPSIDSGGLCADDFAEDDDFFEDYMGGTYDVTCYGCGGKRVVPVLNRDQIDPEILKKIDNEAEGREEYRREREAERRMGC